MRASSVADVPGLVDRARAEIAKGEMPWGASGGFLGDAASAARLVFDTVYRDGEYVGPVRERFMTPREVLENYDFSEINWSIGFPKICDTLTADRATREFFDACRGLTGDTRLSRYPVKGTDARVFSMAYAKEEVSEKEVTLIAQMPKLVEMCCKQYGGDAKEWGPSHLSKMLSSVREAVSQLFTKSGGRSLGLSDPTLSSVKSAVFGLLDNDCIPGFVPKSLMGILVMRLAEESPSEKYRDFVEAEKLFHRVFKRVQSRDCFKREEECPVGLTEAVAWAVDLEDRKNDRKAEELLGLELTWQESLEVQSSVLHYLMLDMSRRNVTWILSCVNCMRKANRDKKMLGYISTTILQYTSAVTQNMVTGRVVKAACSILRLVKVCWSRMLSVCVSRLLQKGNRVMQKTTSLHYQNIRRLEAQIGAIGSIVCCTIKTCVGLAMKRLQLDVFKNTGTRLSPRELSTCRTKILGETNYRITERLSDSVLRNRPRFTIPIEGVPEEQIARELVSKTLVPENQEYNYVVFMGDEDEDEEEEPVDVHGRSSRRAQYVEEVCREDISLPRRAAKNGAFVAVKQGYSECVFPEYAEMEYEEVAPRETWEILDPRTLPILPPEIWVSDLTRAKAALREVLDRPHRLYREDAENRRFLPEMETPQVLRSWLQPIFENEASTSHGLLALAEMMKKSAPVFSRGTPHSRILSALRMWIPPSWALRTDVEAAEIRTELLGGRSMNTESLRVAARAPASVPDWMMVFILQDAQLGVTQEGHATKIRSPLAGIAVTIPTELLYFKTDSVHDLEDIGNKPEDVFSFLVHDVLKKLDLVRGARGRGGHDFEKDCEEAEKAVRSVLESNTQLNKTTLVAWSTLTFNIDQMVDEEKKNPSRRKILSFVQRIAERLNGAYGGALEGREQSIRENATRRAAVFRRLPIAIQSRQVERMREVVTRKAVANEPMSAAEGQFLQKLQKARWVAGRVPSDDLVWAHSLISAFDI